MPINAATPARTVHVHGAEVSTDQSQLWDYAEVLALLVAVIALATAVWIAAAPRPDADLTQPASIAPISGAFERAPDDARDVYQPDPDGPSEVAVVRPSGVDVSQPLTPVVADPLETAAAAAAAGAPPN